LASELLSITISVAILATVLLALFSKKVSVSLIALFWTSTLLGVVFTAYGNALVGLMQIVTFSGAVSVLFLTVILMTGESKLDIGATRLTIAAVVGALVLVILALTQVSPGLVGLSPSEYTDVSLATFSFLWQFRPWDLLILITVFASAMVTVANLFSRET
jgi:NADH:ubiquinone oxidoreductase subunit 6 (subunit J)